MLPHDAAAALLARACADPAPDLRRPGPALAGFDHTILLSRAGDWMGAVQSRRLPLTSARRAWLEALTPERFLSGLSWTDDRQRRRGLRFELDRDPSVARLDEFFPAMGLPALLPMACALSLAASGPPRRRRAAAVRRPVVLAAGLQLPPTAHDPPRLPQRARAV